MSIDGKIATRLGDSEFSSAEDWDRVHKLRCQVDAIMVGVNTILVDDPKLTIKCRRRILKVVADSLARTPSTARIITHRGNCPILIAVGGEAPKYRVEALKMAGAEVFKAGSGRRVNLRRLMAELWRRGVKQVLVEGGGNLNWSLIREDLVDEIYVAVAPVIVGGRDAVTLVEGLGFGKISEAPKFKLLKVEEVGFNLLLKFRRIS
jgi:2,5-diamino-6-hydroxy-4-(5-phosphoribosylamino)pyrimidine 1'-reductase